MLLMLTAEDELLVKMVDFVALVLPTNIPPKFKLEEDSEVERTPTPLVCTTCGLVATSSVRVIAPRVFPSVVGRNVTFIVHAWPVKRVTPEHAPSCE